MDWKNLATLVACQTAREREQTRQARWDAAHIVTVSCKIRREEMAELRRICRQCGTTPYAVVRYMLMVFLGECRRRW